MANPQVTTGNIIAAVAVVIMAFGAGWTLMQSQFAGVEKAASITAVSTSEDRALLRQQITAQGIELKASIADLQNEIRHDIVSQDEFKQFLSRFASLNDRLGKVEVKQSDAAHQPVEKDTIDAIISAADKRIDLIQAQITDINRQIAAALIIIDNNSGVGRKAAPMPP